MFPPCPRCGTELKRFPRHPHIPLSLQCTKCHLLIWESYALELHQRGEIKCERCGGIMEFSKRIVIDTYDCPECGHSALIKPKVEFPKLEAE